MSARPRRVVIAGGGLAGALLACYLGRDGHDVQVYETRPDPRQGPAGGGRSINLAISTRGLFGLAGVGLDGVVLQHAVPMRGRMLHDERGETRFQRYGTRPDEHINSVSRGGLNRLLIEAAGALPNVGLHFGCKVEDVDLERAALRVVTEDGTAQDVRGDLLVGADGAFSRVRRTMQRLPRFDYSQSWLSHGYKELSIPAGPGGSFQLEREALHIWPRGGLMMIALPNIDGSFTCTLFWPWEGEGGFDRLKTASEVRAHFARVYPDAAALMPELEAEYEGNQTSGLVTVRCAPWHYGGRVVLIGDACHAVVPFYGQGANAAFEDCEALARCLGEDDDWGRAIERYGAQRVHNANALADLALANFVEMRDSVRSRWFLLSKAAGKVAHRIFPKLFMPLYSMVSFSLIPYAEAKRRAELQERLLRRAAWVAGGLAGAAALLILARFLG